MEIIRNDKTKVSRPRQSVRTPEGMLRNFLMRVIGPRKLKDLYDRLKPEDKARFLVAILPFVQSRKAAEPFSEAEIEELHSLIKEKSNETGKKVG
jgi:hypothetical protein